MADLDADIGHTLFHGATSKRVFATVRENTKRAKTMNQENDAEF